MIRQRESALPEERPTAMALPAVSIAPDGLESFARDLRALRAKAELDYTDMAEASHYTMKTLVSAAGGLRLPTLPVAVAYVRACGGDLTEWEERWQRLAAKITAEAKKRQGDSDDPETVPEPADQPVLVEPPAASAAQDGEAVAGEVYVITSAKPSRGDWGDEPEPSGSWADGYAPNGARSDAGGSSGSWSEWARQREEQGGFWGDRSPGS